MINKFSDRIGVINLYSDYDLKDKIRQIEKRISTQHPQKLSGKIFGQIFKIYVKYGWSYWFYFFLLLFTTVPSPFEPRKYVTTTHSFYHVDETFCQTVNESFNLSMVFWFRQWVSIYGPLPFVRVYSWTCTNKYSRNKYYRSFHLCWV